MIQETGKVLPIEFGDRCHRSEGEVELKTILKVLAPDWVDKDQTHLRHCDFVNPFLQPELSIPHLPPTDSPALFQSLGDIP